MGKRKQTISKVFYDDEILYKDPDTGAIVLKAGVTRQHYNTHIRPDELESHINYYELGMRKLEENLKRIKGEINPDGGDE